MSATELYGIFLLIAPTGLFNIGNTCFANAAIQSLMACTPFIGYFVDQFDKLQGTVNQRQDTVSVIQETVIGAPSRRHPPYVTAEFSQVISALLLLRSQNDSFSPSRLLTLIRRIFPQFAVGHQHDAQVCEWLLDWLIWFAVYRCIWSAIFFLTVFIHSTLLSVKLHWLIDWSINWLIDWLIA